MRELVGAPPRDPPAVRTFSDEPPAWVPGMRPAPRHGEVEQSRWRDRLRWDPGRRGLIALGFAVVVVLAGTGWWLAAGRPTAMPIKSVRTPASIPPAASASAAPSSVASPSPAPPVPAVSATTVVVDVAGRVRRPGVYTLPQGARVYQAVRAAGGARRGANTVSLNLAAVLQDGQQIVVGAPGVGGVSGGVSGGVIAPAPVGGSVGAGSGGAGPAAPIDLNTATLDQLESLPGIGPVLGQNILDWRAAHQQFTTVDQLSDVTGIGDVRLAQLRPLVTV